MINSLVYPLAGPAGRRCACAAPPADQPAQSVDPRIELAGKIPGTTADELHASPIPGIYELQRGTDIAYVTCRRQVRHHPGDLYDLAANRTTSPKRAGGMCA
jgi:hypothetical protein